MNRPFSRSQAVIQVLVISLSCAALTVSGATALDKIGLGGESYPDMPWFAAVLAVLVAPPLETLLFQQLPYRFARSRGLSKAMTVALMSVPFALAHFSREPHVIVQLLAAAVLWSLIYIRQYPVSPSLAFWTIAMAHWFHNAFTLAVMILSGARMSMG